VYRIDRELGSIGNLGSAVEKAEFFDVIKRKLVALAIAGANALGFVEAIS